MDGRRGRQARRSGAPGLGFKHHAEKDPISLCSPRHGSLRLFPASISAAPAIRPFRCRALYGSVEFIAAYQAAMAAKPPPVGAARTIAGSVNAVIVAYYQSAEFKGLAGKRRPRLSKYPGAVSRGARRQERRRHADEARPATSWRKKPPRPMRANRMLGMISILMEQAIALGLRDDNPSRRRQKVEAQGRRLRHVDRGPDRRLSRPPSAGLAGTAGARTRAGHRAAARRSRPPRLAACRQRRDHD